MRMMAGPTIFAALLALFALAAQPGSAAEGVDAPRTFLAGVEAYGEGDFAESARLFEAVAATGIRNADLYYNLGNAWLRAGELGRAILWYERARLLAPADADLGFNLDYARSLTVDEQEPLDPDVWRVLFFWRGLLGPAATQWAALASVAVLCIGLGALAFRRGPWVLALLWTGVGLTLLFGPAGVWETWGGTMADTGVVLAEELAVRSDRSEEATLLFTLHAGAKVEVERSLEGHYRIRFGRDKIGWAPASKVGLIRNPERPGSGLL